MARKQPPKTLAVTGPKKPRGINGNPAKLEPAPKWEKGVSGNPKGRPKGTRNRSTIFREWLECRAQDGGPGTKADEIARSQILKAAKGDTTAASFVFDNAHGKLKDVIEHIGEPMTKVDQRTTVITDEDAARAYAEICKEASLP